jgi:hypothetical protein
MENVLSNDYTKCGSYLIYIYKVENLSVRVGGWYLSGSGHTGTIMLLVGFDPAVPVPEQSKTLRILAWPF